MAGSCAGFVEPLALQCWIINIFSGTAEIFIFTAVILMAMLSAKFRMKNEVAALMLALFGILFGSFLPGLTTIIILIGGLIAFSVSKRIISTQ